MPQPEFRLSVAISLTVYMWQGEREKVHTEHKSSDGSWLRAVCNNSDKRAESQIRLHSYGNTSEHHHQLRQQCKWQAAAAEEKNWLEFVLAIWDISLVCRLSSLSLCWLELKMQRTAQSAAVIRSAHLHIKIREPWNIELSKGISLQFAHFIFLMHKTASATECNLCARAASS